MTHTSERAPGKLPFPSGIAPEGEPGLHRRVSRDCAASLRGCSEEPNCF